MMTIREIIQNTIDGCTPLIVEFERDDIYGNRIETGKRYFTALVDNLGTAKEDTTLTADARLEVITEESLEDFLNDSRYTPRIKGMHNGMIRAERKG